MKISELTYIGILGLSLDNNTLLEVSVDNGNGTFTSASIKFLDIVERSVEEIKHNKLLTLRDTILDTCTSVVSYVPPASAEVGDVYLYRNSSSENFKIFMCLKND